jgi:hypothetical protein
MAKLSRAFLRECPAQLSLAQRSVFESVPSSASSRKFSSVPAQLSEIFIGQAQHKFCKFKTLGLRAKLSSAY